MAPVARKRSRSRSARTSSRRRRIPTPPVAKSISIDENIISCNTNYCDYLRTILAGIITNIVVVFIFLTLKSVVVLTDFVNLVFSSVLFPVVSFYLLWISVHFIASHTYIHQVQREKFHHVHSILFTSFYFYNSALVNTILSAF